MKKFMFSALACVAFAFSGFASNEVVEGNESVSDLNLNKSEMFSNQEINLEVKKKCIVKILYSNSKGQSFFVELESANDVTESGCTGIKNDYVKGLERQSYTIDKTQTNWG